MRISQPRGVPVQASTERHHGQLPGLSAAEPRWQADFGASSPVRGPEQASPPGHDFASIPVSRPDKASIRGKATSGIGGAANPLPFLETLQNAFGHHDLSGVKAHLGPGARQANRAMGSRGYTLGEHVALERGDDLRTVAHEAVHVVQQRGGARVSGGVGQPGDAYERHADAVAERVVRGQSVEGLLDAHAGPADAGPAPSTAPVQHMMATPEPEFSAASSDEVKKGLKEWIGYWHGKLEPNATSALKTKAKLNAIRHLPRETLGDRLNFKSEDKEAKSQDAWQNIQNLNNMYMNRKKYNYHLRGVRDETGKLHAAAGYERKFLNPSELFDVKQINTAPQNLLREEFPDDGGVPGAGKAIVNNLIGEVNDAASRDQTKRYEMQLWPTDRSRGFYEKMKLKRDISGRFFHTATQ